MKTGGSGYIGDLPQGWEARRLKFLCRVQTGDKDTVEATDEGEYPFFVRSQTIERIGSFTHDCEAVLTAGDGAGVGKVFHYYNGKFDFHQRVYMFNRFKGITAKLFYYYLKENFYKVALDGGAKSTVDSLRLPVIQDFTIPVPPVPNQIAITSYLDKETTRIDALIEKKKRQIELLKEKRQAIITRAVTKGLDPNAKMKDSGVEWIGEMPEGWRVVKIRHLTPVKRGASPRPIDDPQYFDDEGEYSWVRISDVTSSKKYLEITEQRLSPRGVSLSVPLNPGDLFLSIAGSVGKPIITKIKCCIHDGFVYFPSYTQDFEFLYYIFLSGQPFGGLGKMGTQLNLNTDSVGEIRIPCPLIIEQRQIVRFIIRETESIDQIGQLIAKSVSLLSEYRSSLITAAVSGQINVSEEVIA